MSVVKTFYRDLGLFAVDIKDWQINDKKITAIWGRSGAGKTTLLRGLLGLDKESQVEWDFQGKNISLQDHDQKKLGIVFQNSALFPHLSARGNILFPVNKAIHLTWKEDFDELVKTLGLSEILDQPVGRLSGGETQRVSIARALIYRPRMLLLDEPFSSLDEGAKEEARTMLKKINKQWKCPMLLVTHDRNDVKDLAHQVVHLELGKIVRDTPVSEFK